MVPTHVCEAPLLISFSLIGTKSDQAAKASKDIKAGEKEEKPSIP